MSAILSADDLNDFISPGVACIKPVETLPKQRPDPTDPANPYEVTTEDKVAASHPPANAPPAEISLTDCLACSGCVTSAEAVLVSLQSHEEVLGTLDKNPSLTIHDAADASADSPGKVFVASVSPQARASLAATYRVTEAEAGYMVEQLLSGQSGVNAIGQSRGAFSWVIDTNYMREVCLSESVGEARLSASEQRSQSDPSSNASPKAPRLPILGSACPGWICYAEKTHPHVLPHLSQLKSPQALTGTLIKSILSRQYGVSPDKVWHVAVMPCFDKKLEASREELTDVYWKPGATETRGIRDVDCVITAREILMLADSRGIAFPDLPKTPLHNHERIPFPDPKIASFLFSHARQRTRRNHPLSGTSGGYAHEILQAQAAGLPGSQIRTERGRNADVVEYTLVYNNRAVMKTARYYGFRNIQNLVRKLKPNKSRLAGSKSTRSTGNKETQTSKLGALGEYAFVEVMACPGGCTNGGGQIKAGDVAGVVPGKNPEKRIALVEQKEWLAKTDEAYFSAESSDEADEVDSMDLDVPDQEDQDLDASQLSDHWSSTTGIDLRKLICTSFRQVESDVGKGKNANDAERVAGLASSLGGGW